MIEKMYMMNIAGHMTYMNKVIMDILKSNSVNLVNAQYEMDKGNFIFSLDSEQNIDRNIALNYVTSFERNKKVEDRVKRAEKIKEFLEIDKLSEELSNEYDSDKFEELYSEVDSKILELEKIEKDLNRLRSLEQNYELFSNVNIELGELSSLEYFDVRFGTLDKEARFRLKKNYENILAMVFHTSTIGDTEEYMCIYPKEASRDIDRVLRSLNWQDVEILGDYKSTVKEAIIDLSNRETELIQRRVEIYKYRDELIRNKKDELNMLISRQFLLQRIEEVKKEMLRSKDYFYMSGYVAQSDVNHVKDLMSKYKDIHIAFREIDKSEPKPPTKLKNSNFFKPFELLINMYGVPNYEEMDPTKFFAISYLILFGAMFGDLGQGLVFVLIGCLLSYKGKKQFGALLRRLGSASMLFGLLYGSIFGNEEVLPVLFMRPFENITQTLIFAVGFGIVLIFVSFLIGIKNKLKAKDIEDGIFGKEGLSGLVVFISTVGLILSVTNILKVSPYIYFALIAVSLFLMIFKKPIASSITGESLAKHEMEGYYIESTASLLEAVMGIISNIISFIRVGAFAINHVGLFLAFVTIGQMLGNKYLNIGALILGNVVIIALEGLIVFIQSLRLEYYEMFSKYYLGDGYSFEADTI